MDEIAFAIFVYNQYLVKVNTFCTFYGTKLQFYIIIYMILYKGNSHHRLDYFKHIFYMMMYIL